MLADLVKKQIEYRLAGTAIRLELSQSLFSSYQVDIGTQILLSSLRHGAALNLEKTLDLGCGSGVIGIYLKALKPQCELHLTDRDMLAVEFAAHNAALNKVAADCYGSLDLRSAPGDFSSIIFNFPAKLERLGLEAFVYGASNHLRPNGSSAFVVVSELRSAAEAVLARPEIRVDFSKHNRGHSVFHASFNEPIAAPCCGYQRGEMVLPLPGAPVVKTARGIPEYDTLSFATQALLDLLQETPPCSSAAVLEPGQGHAALAAALLLHVKSITLLSRDLLALEFSRRNLEAYFQGGITLLPVPFLSEAPRAELLLWRLEDKNDLDLHLHNALVLKAAGRSVAICGETKLVETLQRKSGLSRAQDRRRGHCCACVLYPA